MFITRLLLFNFYLSFDFSDFFIFGFLLPIQFVQDLLSLVKLTLLFILLLLLRLDLLIYLSNLALKYLDLFVLDYLIILELRLHLRLVSLDGLNRLLVRVDFLSSQIHHFTYKELPVAQFAYGASRFMQFVLNFTLGIVMFLFRTVITGTEAAERAHRHFFFILEQVLA